MDILTRLDIYTGNIASRAINLLTLGPTGGSLCARAYLLYRYTEYSPWWADVLVVWNELIRSEHCYDAARIWKVQAKRYGTPVPPRYQGLIEQL